MHELHPRRIDLSLARCARLLSRLGDPQRALPRVLHLAGTNGKGSTLACLESILQSAGFAVQAYVSPHVCTFSERIRLLGKPIEAAKLHDCLARAEKANGEEPITFFEITTAAAFLAFAENEADFLLLETGLGGRLDATNLAENTKAAIFTPIDYDHPQFLGTELEGITREKIGIAKPDSLLVSARQTCAALLRARAQDLRVPLYMQGEDFAWHSDAQGFELSFEGQRMRLPRPQALGAHQIDNAALGVAALLALRKHGSLPCSQQRLEQACRLGVQQFAQPARLQRITLPALPRTWEIRLDGAHNPHAARALVAALDEHWGGVPYCLIVAMLEGKDVEGFLAPFHGKIACAFAVCPQQDSGVGRFVPSRALAARAPASLDLQPSDSLSQALERLRCQSGAEPSVPHRLLIAGSLYFAAEVLDSAAP